MSAERDAGHSNPIGVHKRLFDEPIYPGRRPLLACVGRSQTLQSQCFAGTRLVYTEATDTALGERVRKTAKPEHFLAAVETIAKNDDRPRAVAVRQCQVPRQHLSITVRNFDTFAVVAEEARAVPECVESFSVSRHTGRSAEPLHAFCSNVVNGGAL